MSVTSVLIVLVVAMFLGLFAFKVIPPRLEYITVKSIGQSVADNEELMKQPKSKVMAALNQSFRANSLWELKADESFLLSKGKNGGYKITVDYEKRSTLFSNIDVVSRFNHTFNEEEGI